MRFAMLLRCEIVTLKRCYRGPWRETVEVQDFQWLTHGSATRNA